MKFRPLNTAASALAVTLSLLAGACKKSEAEPAPETTGATGKSTRYDAAVLSKVTNRISELLGKPVSTITPGKDLVKDLGADSLDAVELVMTLEEDFNIEIDDASAEKMRKVSDVVDYIVSKKKP